ncbi:RNA-binding domain-containing protein [Backusella circina FSU 941]|nr:RNA-binding domain-containing protein [Backusella circina FSU 941]
MSGLLQSTKVDNKLDDLFKHSAGKSEIAVTPVSVKTVTKQQQKKKEKAVKNLGKKAFEAANAARQLSALPPLAAKKRKAVEEEEETSNKKKKKEVKKLTNDEKAEKELRTVFIGNLPVECAEKDGLKQLKERFKECGNIESVRFRSVAFNSTMNRKGAFIARKLHQSREVLNAYIVFSKQSEADAACKLNGVLFMDKHLRVDGASNNKQHDRKRSVFLGALPFDIEDEELWEFFADCGEIESVRTVKDSTINVGKGFGYVQFKDRDSVESALALVDKKFRDKTKIRIERCKIPVSEGGVKSKSQKKTAKASGRKQSGRSGKLIPKPKLFEGTRATKEDGKKMKLQKNSRKKLMAKKLKK